MALEYNANSKQFTLDDKEPNFFTEDTTQINLSQINSLSKSIISESNPNFTPQPNENTTKLIKNLFEGGISKMKQNNLVDALKNVSLAIDMSTKNRNCYESFGVQLQELHFMIKHKIDLELTLGKYLDALQDLDILIGTGVVSPDVFIRKTDALLKLEQFNEAKVTAERGLSLAPNDTKLKAINMECQRRLSEYNGLI